ncbi:MAG: F0F1 ATP synthase subunit epsilon [Hyphomicrobiaceae bacterium]|nr:F0F1 ATP synthase subunit epsilon [Hyphomicrobiaceae bacterium]
MSGTFKFELVSPERILMSEPAEQVVLPGAEGQFTVLSGHTPVVSTLLPGVIHATLTASTKGIYINGGFVEVNPESVTVLAEHAFIVDEADPRMLEAELEKAETALKSADDDEALRHLTSAIEHLKGLQRGKAA